MSQSTTINYERRGVQHTVEVRAVIHTQEHIDALIAQLKLMRRSW